MNKHRSQSGSAHLIIIIILVLALTGTLGCVYWQNFFQPKLLATQNNRKTSDEITDTNEPATETVVLTEIASDQTFGTGLAIKYPKTWALERKVSDESDISHITSPDGKITVNLTAYRSDILLMDQYACKNGLGSVQKIAQLDYDTIKGRENVRFVSFVYSYIASSSNELVYGYYAGAQVDNEAIQAAKVGDYECVFSNTTTTPHIILNDVLFNKTSTLDDFNREAATDSFKVAKQIVQSLYVKD